MASIRVTKKFLKKNKGFLTIKLKDESIEDGDTLFITPDDTTTFRQFGVVFSCAGIDYLHVPYWKFGSIWKTNS